MSLLVDDQKFINLKFHYLEKKGFHVTNFQFIKSKEEYEKLKDDPALKEVNTGWKLLNWAEHNEIYSKCLTNDTNPEGKVTTNIDIIRFRDKKLKACLKNWDVRDDNGAPIPLSSDTIDKLNPQVATEFLDGFEKITELEGIEQKN